jgi:phosphatidylethanolamine-binding protein (PEBP) family uncharacterized protein
MALKLRSPVLAPGGWIPAKYTCDGSNVSPPLRWTDLPSNTKSFAVIVDAQEVSAGARVHWLLYGGAGSLRELPEGVPPLDTVENTGSRAPMASGTSATEARARLLGWATTTSSRSMHLMPRWCYRLGRSNWTS